MTIYVNTIPATEGGVSVPSTSSTEDKNEAAMDRAKGRMKDAAVGP